ANRGNGAGIPVLRMFYMTTVRSLIDYAAPLLVNYSESELKPLEVIQNKAMRMILGCPRTTRIEIMRMELNLCSISHRIKELTAITVIRMIRRGDLYLKMSLDKASGIRIRNKINSYVKKLFIIMTKHGVYKYCVKMKETVKMKPWTNPHINVCITKLDGKKRDLNTHELKALFMSKINKLSKINAVHIYCDGSVIENKVGCGAVIRTYNENKAFTDHMISKRIADDATIMDAELNAICEGLRYAARILKPIFVFSDSQSALLSLQSRGNFNNDVAIQCKTIIIELLDKDINVDFIWIPSHVDIYLNDLADKLAKEATYKDSIDIEGTETIKTIKSKIRKQRTIWEAENIQTLLNNGSESLNHYLYVFQNTNVT
ncbi:MAG: ribonuclease H family protein, partial [Cyanobacteria bacterium J06614_10]